MEKTMPMVYFCWIILVVLVGVTLVDSTKLDLSRSKRSDALRCKWSSGVLCKWSCRAFGHSDGFCDEDNECRCSEVELEKYVCGGEVKNSTADALCAGWCQVKGIQTGDCNLDKGECECSPEELSTGHVKCVTDEVCSFYCQFKEKKATGMCTGPNGWDCVCLSNDSKNTVMEDEEE